MLLLSLSLYGCASKGKASPINDPNQANDSEQTVGESEQTNETTEEVNKEQSEAGSVMYHNTKYGFDFTLPASWESYKIVTEKWEGLALDGSQGEKVVETGPLVLIRHPEWTSQNIRQDIPIIVFTLSQWESLQNETFHIGAAPIGPSELGRNSKYVFALPARYNFAFPIGYEEVENILNNHPLLPTETFQ